ncbi:hypothetical protein GCM10009804_03470 [Kribbella hippodromi]|uniref:Knr4/Smi1-like domain-containing protein n=1 Tax=Kribbella hippodromi TaxID=434347 RepID=A0ABP4MTR7_9ACTN
MDAAAWRDLLRDGHGWLELQPPVDPDEIAAAEVRLGVTFPSELRGLFRATDGIYDKRGQWFVLWRLEDVVQRNLEAGNGLDYATRRLLSIGDDGTGAPFCITLDGESAVFSWSPIEREARPLAPGLRKFWLGWLAGEIST